MRKREKRIRRASHTLGTDERGFGWATRQAARRAGRRLVKRKRRVAWTGGLTAINKKKKKKGA